MPRQPRSDFPWNGPFHITCRGNDQRNIFLKTQDYEVFLTILNKCKEEFGFLVYHYALMTNHYHLLLQPKSFQDLSRFMHAINRKYCEYFRKKYSLVGHLWQDRFSSKPVMTDEYLLICGIYIELNPVPAGMIEEPQHYPWTSYRQYLENPEMIVSIDRSPTFLTLSENEESRKIIFKQLVDYWKTQNPKKFREAAGLPRFRKNRISMSQS